MILTRYLYNKEYVEYSLLLSLLRRDKEEAIFWTYELYHSGFRYETMFLLWKFYFTLYSAFYVNLESYFQEKTNTWLSDTSNDEIVGNIVLNLAVREPCIDLYCMMHQMIPYVSVLKPWVHDIEEVSGEPSKCIKILQKFVHQYHCFERYGQKKIMKDFKNTCKIHLIENLVPLACISRLFTGLFLLDNKNKMDVKDYFTMSEEQFENNKNKPFIRNKGWKIPQKRCAYDLCVPPKCQPIDKKMLCYNWLYYTWDTPIWRKRIQRYNGDKCETSIMFTDEDCEEDFYEIFNLEPDEQCSEVISKWEGYIPYKNWEDIYNTYSLDILQDWLVYNNYITI